MGKKGKKSMKTAPSLQELQSTVNGMSISQALAAVKAATAAINDTKHEQEVAARALQQARDDIAKSNSDSRRNSDHYSEKDFWDKRYEADVSTYEWYVSFENIKKQLLLDLRKCDSRLAIRNPPLKIMVSGCGNSTLCEDLWREGFRHIWGMDYSQQVIDTMQKRCVKYSMDTVQYIQADGCNIPCTMHSSCRAIIDKGTLDAIASGDGSDSLETTEGSSLAAVAYLKNMWALLVTGGSIIIISTMPPSPTSCVSTSIYEVKPLKTDEGGDVYYYVLTKTTASASSGSLTEIPSHAALTRQFPRVAGASPASTEELATILQEAQAAMRELEEAKRQVAVQTKQRESIKSEVEEAEKRACEISRTLDSSWKNASSFTREDLETNEEPPPDAPRLKDDKEHLAVLLPPPPLELQTTPKQVPKVELRVLYESSEIAAEGYVDVEYELKGGEWDEDDLIALEEKSDVDAAAKKKVSSQPLQEAEQGSVVNESPYFEYTDEPRPVSGKRSVLVGRVRVKFPSYGGMFALVYKRVQMEIIPTGTPPVPSQTEGEGGEGSPVSSGQANCIVVRSNRWLATSEMLSVPFALQQLSRFSRKSILCRGNRGLGGLVKIEKNTSCAFGANVVIPNQYDRLEYVVEDMRNIGTIAISIGSSDTTKHHTLSKAAAWVTSIEGTNTTALTIECDVSSGTEEGVLSYSVVLLPLNDGWSLELSEAYGLVTEDGAVGGGGDCVNRLLIKIPYVRESVLSSAITRTSPVVTPNGCEDTDLPMGLSCSFCSALLLSQSKISSLETLPSGLFDHIMHEFVCSESTPTMPLAVNDMATPRGSVYLGDIFLSVSPLDVKSEALMFQCKNHPSLLDVVAGTGHIVENVRRAKDMHATAGATSLGDLQMIDTSTCSVTCTRCLCVLGDGQVAADDFSGETMAEKSEGDSQFGVSDLQDVRLLRDKVAWRGSLPLPASAAVLMGNMNRRYTSEKVITNALLAMVNRFEISSFELFVPTVYSTFSHKLLVRILTRVVNASGDSQGAAAAHPPSGYAVYSPHFHEKSHHSQLRQLDASGGALPCWFGKEAVKASFRVADSSAPDITATGRLSSTGKGAHTKASGEGNSTPKRVPVDYHTFQEVQNALESRTRLFGPSFFPGEAMSFLYR